MSISRPISRSLSQAISQTLTGGVAVTAALHAAIPDPVTGEMRGMYKGFGAVLEGCTSTRWRPDHESIWRSFGPNVLAWTGARTVENKVPDSTDLSSWTLDSLVVRTDKGDGVWEIDSTAGGNHSGLRLPGIHSGGAIGDTSIHTYDVRYVTSAGDNTLRLTDPNDSGTLTTITLTADWQRLVHTQVNGATAAGIWFQAPSAGVQVFEVRRVQFEDSTGRSDTTTPSEYVATFGTAIQRVFGWTNGNSVNSDIMTEATGSPLSPAVTLHATPAEENVFLYSNDQTNGVYSTTAGVTVTRDQVGMTGAPNTACKIDDSSGSVQEGIWQNTTDTIASFRTEAVHLFFAKESSITNRCRIEVKGSGFVELTAQIGLNHETGAIWIADDEGIMDFVQTVIHGDTIEVILQVYPHDGSTNTDFQCGVFPSAYSADDEVGSGQVSLTGDCTVKNMAVYVHTLGKRTIGFTPIFTAATPESIEASDLTLDVRNHSNVEGCWMVTYTSHPLWVSDFNEDCLIVGSGTGRYLYHTSANFRSFDGTNTAIDAGVTMGVDLDIFKMGVAYGDSKLRINTDAVWGTEVAYDGEFGNSFGEIRLLRRTTGSATRLVREISNIQHWQIPYDDATAEVEAYTA